jgi:hypothetical protein
MTMRAAAVVVAALVTFPRFRAVTRSGRVFTAVTRDGRRTIRETRFACAQSCRLGRVTTSLDPSRNTAGGRTLGMPTCASTTRGIDVSETDLGDLSVAGAYDEGGRTSYFRLPDYHDLDRSAKIRKGCGTPLMIPFPPWLRR